MTNILELLKNEKVEWKKLGEVANIQRGRVISKKYLEEHRGEFPVYSSQTKNDGIIGKIDTYDFDGEYITWTTDGAYAGTVFYRYGKFSITNICGLIKPKDNLIIKYLCYWLQIEAKKHVTGGSGNPKLMSNVVANIQIPIPSPETQEKIVKILDKFTNYVTELQSELQSRTKQYIYYRDKLLSEEYLTKVTKEMEEDRRLNVVTLGEIGEFTRGNGLQKKDFQEEGNPVIHYGQIYTKYGFVADEVLSYVSDEIFSKLRKAQKNDILIATTSENVEDVGKSIVWLGDEEIGFSGDMYSYRTEQNSKYIAYYFQTNAFQKQKERKATGTKMIRIHAEDMEKFEIPLPPLSLQNKIVKVLDKFQVLLADRKGLLPAEIEERQKQYEYYREKLLTFDEVSDRFDSIRFITSLYYDILQEVANIVEIEIDDRVEELILGDIGKISMCKRILKNQTISEGDIPFYKIGTFGKKADAYISRDLFEEYKGKYSYPKKGEILLSASGTIGRTIIFNGEDSYYQDSNIVWLSHDEDKILNSYLYYCYQIINWNPSTGGTIKRLYNYNLININIVVPPLHVQQHVVNILDKFDTLVNDIKEGLPKEIEQRQQQYEYWRECLLNFPR